MNDSNRIDEDENGLLEAYEAGEFVSDLTEKRRNELIEAAQATVKKDKRINIRTSNRDPSLK